MLHVFVSAPVLLSIPMFLPSPLSTSTASYQSEMDMNQSTLTKVKYVPPRKSHASSHHEKHRDLFHRLQQIEDILGSLHLR